MTDKRRFTIADVIALDPFKPTHPDVQLLSSAIDKLDRSLDVSKIDFTNPGRVEIAEHFDPDSFEYVVKNRASQVGELFRTIAGDNPLVTLMEALVTAVYYEAAIVSAEATKGKS